jgi:O-antigen/teichoic acid export membrane protein
MKAIKHTILYSFGTLFGRGIQILALPYILSFIQAEGYSHISVFQQLVTILVFLTTLNSDYAATNYYFYLKRQGHNGDVAYLTRLFFQSLFVFFVSVLLYFLWPFLAKVVSDELFLKKGCLELYFLLVVILFFQTPISVYLVYLRSIQKAKTVFWWNIIYGSLPFLLMILFLYVTSLPIAFPEFLHIGRYNSFFWAMAMVHVLFGVLALIKMMPWLVNFVAFSNHLRKLFLLCLPLIPGNFALIAMTYFHPFLFIYFINKLEFSSFALAMMLSQAILAFVNGFWSAFNPVLLKSKNTEDMQSHASFSFDLYMQFGFGLWFLLCLFVYGYVIRFTDLEFWPARYYFVFLSLQPLIYGFTNFSKLSSDFTLKGSVYFRSVLLAFVFTVLILCNLFWANILLRQMLMTVSGCLSFLILVLCFRYFSKSIEQIKLNWIRPITFFLIYSGILGLCFLSLKFVLAAYRDFFDFWYWIMLLGIGLIWAFLHEKSIKSTIKLISQKE